MGLSGLWQQRAAHDYTGATRWGNGVDPIHAVHDQGRGRVIGTRENLYPLGEPSDAVSPGLTAREIDWVCEDYVEAAVPGEYFRYQDEHPRWNEATPQFRDLTNSPAMGEQAPWGVVYDANPDDGFPLAGPTSGMQHWLDVDHGEVEEQQVAIAVPTPMVSGGWLGKVRGQLAKPEAQDATQPGFVPTINTAGVQGPGLKESANERALARGTDDPRSPIESRTAGMRDLRYGRSFGMGGGPGTPDMQPFQQTAGLKRPFMTRVAATPPIEDHFMNTMEGRTPLQRATSPDPYQGDPEVGPGGDTTVPGEWGF